MRFNPEDLINKIIIYLIEGLVFILPLFFLPDFSYQPLTNSWLEFTKQYLLWLIIPLIVILWLLKIILDKEINFKRTPLDIPILVFLAIAFFSSVFSLDKFSSFFGYYGLFSNAYLGLFSLGLLYFVITNFSTTNGELRISSLVKLAAVSLAIAVIILIAGVFGWLGENSAAFNPFIYPELDYGNALSIANNTIQSKPIFGSGPGTFSYDFSQYRNKELNSANLWQYRFNQSPSYILEIATTLGAPGMLSYFLIISLFFYLLYLFRRKIILVKNKKIIISLIIAFFIIFILQIFYPANSILLFLFWLLLSLVMALLSDLDSSIFKKYKLAFINNKFIKIVPFIFLIIFSLWLILLTIETKFLIAELNFISDGNKEDKLLRAIELNPYRFNYQINLAKYYLNIARAEAIKPNDARDNELIQLSIDKSINWARTAVKTKPNSVLTQETLGMIYRDVRMLTVGSEPWAIDSFGKAVRLEPTNPVLFTELGKAYLNNNQIPEAIIAFRQALELKRDYWEAAFSLAKALAKDKKEAQALVILDSLATVVPDPEIFFERGRLYYNQGEIGKAIESFNKVLESDPSHANALYSLGLAYEVIGKDAEALELFKKVLEFNPANTEVLNKIDHLKK